MRMLLLAVALFILAAPAFACTYNQTASQSADQTVASGSQTPPPAGQPPS
jgi:hypothetical protein